MLSGYVGLPSPIRLRFLGLIIQQELKGFGDFGYRLASEAILQQHLEEYRALKTKDILSVPLFEPPSSGIEGEFKPIHFVFYCEEYGNAWWPM